MLWAYNYSRNLITPDMHSSCISYTKADPDFKSGGVAFKVKFITSGKIKRGKIPNPCNRRHVVHFVTFLLSKSPTRTPFY